MYSVTSIKKRYEGLRGTGLSLRQALINDTELLENVYLLLYSHFEEQTEAFRNWAKDQKKAPNDALKKSWVAKQARDRFAALISISLTSREICENFGIPWPVKVLEVFDPLAGAWLPYELIISACHSCQWPLFAPMDQCLNCNAALARDRCLHCNGDLKTDEIEFCSRHTWEHRLI